LHKKELALEGFGTSGVWSSERSISLPKLKRDNILWKADEIPRRGLAEGSKVVAFDT
jgi:hypothetical protein